MHDPTPWQHSHRFDAGPVERRERATRAVALLTFVAMLAEVACGLLFNSMALLADGWHMATHAGALAISALAYRFARRHADNPAFAFGTGKVGALAGFASATLLAFIALLVATESVLHLLSRPTIRFDEAIVVAVIGLLVNLASIALLHEHHDHGHHGHPTHHDDPAQPHAAGGHHGHDHNLRAAYLHVLADAATSVLAIVALVCGKYFGAWWLDPVMGIVGALLIGNWARGLLRDTGHALLDVVPDPALAQQVRSTLEHAGYAVADLHLWPLGGGHNALIVSVVAPAPCPPETICSLLAPLPHLSHITIQVNPG